MIRVLGLAVGALAACSGPSSMAPTGFGRADCAYGPRISGSAGMGVGNDGVLTDLDATVGVGVRTDGGCVGAPRGDDA